MIACYLGIDFRVSRMHSGQAKSLLDKLSAFMTYLSSPGNWHPFKPLDFSGKSRYVIRVDQGNKVYAFRYFSVRRNIGKKNRTATRHRFKNRNRESFSV